jgi:hypothetical protein
MILNSDIFDERTRTLLDSLVYMAIPGRGSSAHDDAYEPTFSAIIGLFGELVEENTPDLYLAEWELIANSLDPISGHQRLPNTLDKLTSQLILSLEDMDMRDGKIDSHLLGWKLAGLEKLQLCAIYYHVQKYLVAEYRGLKYDFPSIEFKG